MRRRPKTAALVEPPGRLLAYDPVDWLPLVDPADYDPDDYRNRRNWLPYGEPGMTFEDWRRQQALTLWSRARLGWHKEYGWPGGLDYIDLFRQTVQMCQQSVQPIDPFRLQRG